MVGIIAEYNPFHNGHLKQIEIVKEMFKDEVIAVVLAGPFLNRGDVSIIDKWDKTKLALEYGVDIVLELPFVFATQAADYYAYGGVKILDLLKASYLVFGSETNDLNHLTKIANKNLEQNKLKENIKKGYNYPTSIAKAINSNINEPNDLLGISYIKAINKLKSNIKPITIKRSNSYHSLDVNSDIISASAIRNLVKNNENIDKYVPSKTLKYIKNRSLNDYFYILKYKIMNEDISKYVDIKINNRLKKVINDCNNIDELISKVKTKNYSYNYIKRSLVHILCEFETKHYDVSYVRVLGFNSKGQEYLKSIKKDVKLITNYCNILEYELKVSNIYNMFDKEYINKELNKPIKLD